MARQVHTPHEDPSITGAVMTKVTQTAADVANYEEAAFTGREFILIQNTGASPHNVTITSVARDGRTNDLTEAVAAGVWKITPRFPLSGWRQTGALLYFSADHAEIKFSVIRTGN